MRNVFFVILASLLVFCTPYRPAHAAMVNPVGTGEIQDFINAGGTRILFLYASWCPYCKKQIEGFRQFPDANLAGRIMAISTDSSRVKFAKFMQQQQNFPFVPYIYEGYEDLSFFIRQHGGSFSGGIPYFIVFQNGQFKQEFIGLTHPQKLSELAAK